MYNSYTSLEVSVSTSTTKAGNIVNLMVLVRRLLAFQRQHNIEFNVAGVIAGVITSGLIGLGLSTSGDKPAAHRDWFSRSLLNFLHDGGYGHLVIASFEMGVAAAVMFLPALFRLRGFLAYRRLQR